MKRITAIILIFILSATSVFAVKNENVNYDKVANSYVGNGDYNIKNANFVDVAGGFWAKDEISKLSALGIYKGYTYVESMRFAPNSEVSKEEALALMLRLVGKQAEVQAEAEKVAEQGVKGSWSTGYLKVAADMGLITQADYEAANADAGSSFGGEQSFVKTDPATREEVAVWASKAVESVQPGMLAPNSDFKNIYNVADFEEAEVTSLPYIETLMRKKIMVGRGTYFRPKRGIKRSEMAKVLVNMEDILYKTLSLKQKSGLVGGVRIDDEIGSFEQDAKKIIKVRNNDGKTDELVKDIFVGEDGVLINRDCVVLKNGRITGLAALEDGDKIRYVVNDLSQQVLYVNVTGKDEPREVVGVLQGGLDLDKGIINIMPDDGTRHSYKMRESLYDKEQGIVVVGFREVKKEDLPYTNKITLILENDMVVRIEYKGAEALYSEISGTVVDVNPKFKYITITDANGQEETKHFLADDVVVERLDYFVSENDIGHIDEIFDEKKYDKTDAYIEDLEPGDIVHLRINGDKVTSISSKSFTSRKTGTIKSVSIDGEGAKIVLDDGSLLSLDVPKSALVKKDGRISSVFDLKVGQYVDLTINDAVVGKGRLKNIVKKLEVFTRGTKVKNVYMSKLGLYNDVQNTLSLLQTSKLSKVGFKDYLGDQVYDIMGDVPKIIYNGKRVPLDFLKENLQGSDLTVYSVTKDYYGEEKLDTLYFDEGRGVVLDEDVVGRKQNGEIRLGNSRQEVAFNKNAIAIKDGYLVSMDSIENNDNVQVVMGNRDGVIFNVVDKVGEADVFICRARIKDIEKRTQMTVKSFARLKDFEYKYSPIERKFRIDENTQVYEDGLISLDEFLSYGKDTRKDKVYTIFADGDYAEYLIMDKYAREAVKGEVASLDGDKIEIVDTKVYTSKDKTLTPIDLNNTYAELKTDEKTMIVKNGKLVQVDELEVGDKLEVMTIDNLYKQFAETEKRDILAKIIIVK